MAELPTRDPTHWQFCDGSLSTTEIEDLTLSATGPCVKWMRDFSFKDSVEDVSMLKLKKDDMRKIESEIQYIGRGRFLKGKWIDKYRRPDNFPGFLTGHVWPRGDIRNVVSMNSGLVELDMSRANLSCYEHICKILNLPVNITLSRETLCNEMGVSIEKAKSLLMYPWTMDTRPKKTKCDLYECYVNAAQAARAMMWKHEDFAWIRAYVQNVRGKGIGSFMHYIYEFMISRIMIRIITRFKKANIEIASWNRDGIWMKEPASEDDVISLAKSCGDEIFPGMVTSWKIKRPTDAIRVNDDATTSKWQVPTPAAGEDVHEDDGDEEEDDIFDKSRPPGPTYSEAKVVFETQYAKVHSKFRDFKKFDQEQSELLSRSDLITVEENSKYWSWDRSSEKPHWVKKSFVCEWLRDEHMRSYIREGRYPDVTKCPDNVFNTYEQVACVKEFQRAKPKLITQETYRRVAYILRHCYRLFQNDEFYNFFITWMACIIRRPWKKVGVMVWMLGTKRTGKGKVIEFLFEMLGAMEHCGTTKNPSVDVWGTNGNKEFLNKTLIRHSEPRAECFAPEKEGGINIWVTDEVLPCKGMHENSRQEYNYSAHIVDANEVLVRDTYNQGRHAYLTCQTYWRKKCEDAPDPGEAITEYFGTIEEYSKDKSVRVLFLLLLHSWTIPPHLNAKYIPKTDLQGFVREKNRTSFEQLIIKILKGELWRIEKERLDREKEESRANASMNSLQKVLQKPEKEESVKETPKERILDIKLLDIRYKIDRFFRERGWEKPWSGHAFNEKVKGWTVMSAERNGLIFNWRETVGDRGIVWSFKVDRVFKEMNVTDEPTIGDEEWKTQTAYTWKDKTDDELLTMMDDIVYDIIPLHEARRAIETQQYPEERDFVDNRAQNIIAWKFRRSKYPPSTNEPPRIWSRADMLNYYEKTAQQLRDDKKAAEDAMRAKEELQRQREREAQEEWERQRAKVAEEGARKVEKEKSDLEQIMTYRAERAQEEREMKEKAEQKEKARLKKVKRNCPICQCGAWGECECQE